MRVTKIKLTYKQSVKRNCDVLFSYLASDEESFEVLEECSTVEWLGITVLIIARNSMIFYNSFENSIH
jgi:hypothetical protein